MHDNHRGNTGRRSWTRRTSLALVWLVLLALLAAAAAVAVVMSLRLASVGG
jgi:hypothetical protein